MKKRILAFILIIMVSGVTSFGQEDIISVDDIGVSVVCEDFTIDGGVEILVNNMMTGLDYTVTAVGIGGFNPVMAVVQEDGLADCADDSREANNFAADLPTTGFVEAQNRNPSIRFRNNVGGDEADVSIVVGGFENSFGEFLVIIEGMSIGDFDLEGDVFSIFLSNNILATDFPPTVYAVSVTGGLDPVIYLVDDDNTELFDENDEMIYCDDAGFEEICWGDSVPLDGYYVSRSFNRQLTTFEYDSMLGYDRFDPEVDDHINYRVGSYLGNTFGDYVVVFHIKFVDPDAVPEATETP